MEKMEKIVMKTLKKVNFAERFKGLCNFFNDLENEKNFSIPEIKKLLKENNIDFKYDTDKSFIKEVEFKKFQFRSVFRFRKGLNEGFFVFTNKNSEKHLYNRFNGFVKIIDPQFTYPKYNTIPVATSIEDLKAIIIEYHSLYQDVLNELLKTEKLEENETV